MQDGLAGSNEVGGLSAAVQRAAGTRNEAEAASSNYGQIYSAIVQRNLFVELTSGEPIALTTIEAK